MESKEIVLAYWRAMETNDFGKASEWLSENYEGHWPQSSEIIVGRRNFKEINSQYPAQDKWIFNVNSIVCEEGHVVTDVSITDGE